MWHDTSGKKFKNCLDHCQNLPVLHIFSFIRDLSRTKKCHIHEFIPLSVINISIAAVFGIILESDIASWNIKILQCAV